MERSPRGKFIMREDGKCVPLLEPPEGVTPATAAKLHASDRVAEPAPLVGPSRVGEWLMVDIRAAKRARPGTRLHRICRALSDAGSCGVIESTLVIDLDAASPDDARFLANKDNWSR